MTDSTVKNSTTFQSCKILNILCTEDMGYKHVLMVIKYVKLVW